MVYRLIDMVTERVRSYVRADETGVLRNVSSKEAEAHER